MTIEDYETAQLKKLQDDNINPDANTLWVESTNDDIDGNTLDSIVMLKSYMHVGLLGARLWKIRLC